MERYMYISDLSLSLSLSLSLPYSRVCIVAVAGGPAEVDGELRGEGENS